MYEIYVEAYFEIFKEGKLVVITKKMSQISSNVTFVFQQKSKPKITNMNSSHEGLNVNMYRNEKHKEMKTKLMCFTFPNDSP